MNLHRPGSSRWVAAALIAVVTAAVGSVARAADVRWTVDAHVAPGVTLGVGNTRPIYYAPPVYVQPAPVYYTPAPVYYTAPTYYYVRPAPAYYGTQVIYRSGHRHRGHGHRHHHRRNWH